MTSTRASFEATIGGLGELEDIDPPVKAIQNATLRHTATSNVEIATTDLGPELRQYADVFADVELRVQLWDSDGNKADSERVFKGILEEIDTQGQESNAVLKTKGRGWHLETDEALVEFENIRVWEAIEQYLNQETDFEVEVVPDLGSPVVSDELAQNPVTQSDWETLLEEHISETDPVAITDGELALLQTSNTLEAQFFINNESGTENLSGLDEFSSGGGRRWSEEGDRGTSVAFDVEYTIPEEHVTFAVRLNADTGTAIQASVIDDDTGSSVGSLEVWDGGAGSDLFYWRPDGPIAGIVEEWTDGDIDPGTYRIQLQATSGPGDVDIDLVTVYDDRFNYDFDGTVHEPEGYLPGPEDYPDEFEFELPITERETQVDAAYLTSVWDDLGNGQAVALSNDGGDNYVAASNTDSLDVFFSDEELFGSQLLAKFTFSRYPVNENPQDETPRFGYQGQSVDEFELRFDQTTIAVIDELDLSDSHKDNLRTLCQRGRMHWSIDHTADGKRIDVFPIGTEAEAEWSTKNWSRTDGSTDYANRVVARGARKPEEEQEGEEDIRYEAVVTDNDEIQRLVDLGLPEEQATISRVISDPEWQSQETVNQQAFAALEGFVESRLPSGTINIVPTFIRPGYAYQIPEFEVPNGDVPTKTLEQVQFSQSYDGASGSLQFEAVQNWVSALSPVEDDVGSIKRLF